MIEKQRIASSGEGRWISKTSSGAAKADAECAATSVHAREHLFGGTDRRAVGGGRGC
jgi:hypothetical protein